MVDQSEWNRFASIVVIVTTLLVVKAGTSVVPDGGRLACDRPCHCSLLHADCSSRGITITNEIRPGNLTSVTLEGNGMTDISNQSFQNNLNLRDINLARNELSTLPDGLFQNLRNLVSLNITFNKLHQSHFPLNIFKDQCNLRVLSMNNQVVSRWQQPPAEGLFLPLSSLQELHMTGPYKLFPDFAAMTKLTVLDLSGGNLSNLSSPMLSPLRSLRNVTVLSLRACMIVYMPADFLTSYPKLRRLDVSHNRFLGERLGNVLQAMHNSTLEVLVADIVSSSSTEARRTLTERCFNIFKALASHPQLLALSVRGNCVSPHDNHAPLHRLVPNLRYFSIDLYGTRSLSGLYRSHSLVLLGLDLLQFPQLRILKLASPDIFHSVADPLIKSRVYPWEKYGENTKDIKEKLQQIALLILASNSTSPYIDYDIQVRLYEIIPWKAIFVDDFKTWGIGRRTRVLSCHAKANFTILFEELELNEVETTLKDIIVTEACILNGPHLKKISLRSCSFVYISGSVFHGFPRLTFLDLHDNNLGGMLYTNNAVELFDRSCELKYLNLCRNNIAFLTRNVFQSLFSLETLDLSNNIMEVWTANLNHCNHLKLLDLSGNQFKTISPESLQLLPPSDFLKIDLYKNQLVCDCTADSIFAVNWFSSRTDKNSLGQSDNYYECNNRNNSVIEWASLVKSDAECTSTTENNMRVQILVASLIVALILLLTGFTVYQKKFTILYKFYKWRGEFTERHHNPHFLGCGSMLLSHHTSNMSLYLAVDELEALWPFLIREDIGFHTRNCPTHLGSRWENVVHDIEAADVVIITLSPHCLTDDEHSADFSYAIEKGIERIVTIVKGDVGSLATNWWGPGKCVKRLLNQTTKVEWPADGEVNEGFLQLLKVTCEAKKRHRRKTHH